MRYVLFRVITSFLWSCTQETFMCLDPAVWICCVWMHNLSFGLSVFLFPTGLFRNWAVIHCPEILCPLSCVFFNFVIYNGIYLILLSFTIALMVFWINIQLLLCIYAMVSFHHPRVALKKLIVAQLVKKFPTLCKIWRFITLFTKSQYWFLFRVKSLQSIVTVYFKICF